MSQLFQDSGLPAEALNVIQGLVSGAGYDVEDEADLLLGMTAVMSTLRVCEAVGQRRAPRDTRVGRNDPCLCGSGKKHKKCCLKAGGATQKPERYDPGDPLERVDLVPRIYDMDALAGDLKGLEALFCSDETLREIRFTPEKMMAFLHSAAGQQVRTNNHVERTNRKLRYFEKVRYKWRRRRSIIRFVLLALQRWWQDHPNAEPHAISRNPTNKAKPSHNNTYRLSG